MGLFLRLTPLHGAEELPQKSVQKLILAGNSPGEDSQARKSVV
jgi:hypothetical protein